MSLSPVCKVMETLVRDAICNHLDKNNLICDQQHGFRARRSCSTQLLKVINDLSESMDNRHLLDVIYLDYRKAFNRVPHQRLLKKLHAYRIRGNILQWINALIIGKTHQQTKVTLGRSHQWNITRKCVRTDSVPNIHERFARRYKKYIATLCR